MSVTNSNNTNYWHNDHLIKYFVSWQSSERLVPSYIECLALNGNTIKHYISWTIKCIREIKHFQTVDLTKFLMCSVYPNMGTISGTTHIQTIFSFSPGTGKHFTDNALCSPDDFVMQLIHILHLFMIIFFYKLPEGKIQSQIWRMGGGGEVREWVPLFLSNNQETPCPETYEHDRRSEVVVWWYTKQYGGPFCCKTFPVSNKHLSQSITSINQHCLVQVHLITLAFHTSVGF
jgi:hypothetical protein